MAEKKHRWNRQIKGFCDTGMYCIDCGLQREKHGLNGIYYFDPKTKKGTFKKPNCNGKD